MKDGYKAQLISDYEKVLSNKFWGVYVLRILKYQERTYRDLEHSDVDRFRVCQGRMEAIKEILGYPEKMLEELKSDNE